MFIEVHFGGVFEDTAHGRMYAGGQCKEICDFDTDEMGFFELRYLLKQCGLQSDYRIHCLKLGGNLESGLELVDSDKTVLKILNYLDFHQNIMLYIEHLSPGADKHLLLPDYCLPEKPVCTQDTSSERCERPSNTTEATSIQRTPEKPPVFRRIKQTVRRRKAPIIEVPDKSFQSPVMETSSVNVAAQGKIDESPFDDTQQGDADAQGKRNEK